MKTKLILLITSISLLYSCASTVSTTWSKNDRESKSYQKILVVTQSSTPEARINSENLIVEQFQKQGINATNSINIFPAGEDIKSLSAEEINTRILAGGYDAVMISSLTNVPASEIGESGEIFMKPATYVDGMRVNRGFIYEWDRDTYNDKVIHVLVSQLYDTNKSAVDETLVWAGQATVPSLKDFEKASEGYAKKIVKSLVVSGVIKL